MQILKDEHQFAPSKRAFQTQFKRWNFPSKQNPAHRNVDLVTRVKELWEQNYSQRDMVRTLNEEGFQIKERELMRVRAKNRWLLRIPNGQKATAEEDAFQQELLDAANMQDDAVQTSEAALASMAASLDPVTQGQAPVPPTPEEVPEEVVRKRKERHDKMKAESDERWAAKKRRRRTREYAGIAADPPGPPRFPSETTLGESMEFLSMDADAYKVARGDFQRICEDMRIIKKTLAGTEKWAEAKQRLIVENAHLAAVFGDPTNKSAKGLALDVICTDVTKRMRTVETRMTIVDAKNILGVNPEQSRQIRNSFYLILQNDHFTSKLETGPEHWNDLKEQWIQGSRMLQEIMRPDQEEAVLEKKRKALEVLCRDVMKRLRDAQKRGDNGPPRSTPKSTPARAQPQLSPPSAPPLPTVPAGNFELTEHDSDIQIDPSLLQSEHIEPALPPVAVYVKPSPDSEISAKLFLTTLTMRTHHELLVEIHKRWQGVIAKIEGVVTHQTGDLFFPVDSDEELNAYLEEMQGNKIVFMVRMNKAFDVDKVD